MKKITFGILTLLLCFISSNAITQTWDGYFWEEMSKSEKVFYITGYLPGYYAGATEGSFASTRNFLNELNASNECKLCLKKYKLMFGFLGFDALKYGDMFKDHNIGYYLKEINSFYQTYPLCKGKNLDSIMGDLVKVWAKKHVIDKPLTYKEIGEKCLQKK